jgi:hypothetical protein
MFEPDVLLPAQFSALRSKPLRGEQRLLIALLGDAIDCFRSYHGSQRPREQQLFRDAEEWIESTDTEWVFAFENVCDALGLHAGHLREALRRWQMASSFRKSVRPRLGDMRGYSVPPLWDRSVEHDQ